MQFQKDYVFSAILRSAEKEFLKNGFKNASLRQIAHGAEVTLSNIYNYFPDKDALLMAILQPILADIEKAKTFLEQMESNDDHADEKSHLGLLDFPIQYVCDHNDLFKLLFFGVEGSSLAGFTDAMIQWFGDLMHKNMTHIVRKHQLTIEPPTDYFLKSIGSIWVQLITDSVRNDRKQHEIIINARELMRFVYHGWIGFFGVES